MECQYCVVKTTYMTDKSARDSFGIAAVAEEDGSITVLETISDLCADYEVITRFVQLCNDLKLDPIHLQDVADDFLADF